LKIITKNKKIYIGKRLFLDGSLRKKSEKKRELKNQKRARERKRVTTD